MTQGHVQRACQTTASVLERWASTACGTVVLPPRNRPSACPSFTPRRPQKPGLRCARRAAVLRLSLGSSSEVFRCKFLVPSSEAHRWSAAMRVARVEGESPLCPQLSARDAFLQAPLLLSPLTACVAAAHCPPTSVLDVTYFFFFLQLAKK